MCGDDAGLWNNLTGVEQLWFIWSDARPLNRERRHFGNAVAGETRIARVAGSPCELKARSFLRTCEMLAGPAAINRPNIVGTVPFIDIGDLAERFSL